MSARDEKKYSILYLSCADIKRYAPGLKVTEKRMKHSIKLMQYIPLKHIGELRQHDGVLVLIAVALEDRVQHAQHTN